MQPICLLNADGGQISTLRGFGRVNGWGKLIVGNLFAYRAIDVRKLTTIPDPVGPHNDFHLDKIIAEANQVVYAWGALSKQPKNLKHRWLALHELVLKVGHTPLCLGAPLKDGHPHHPQHLSQNCGVRPWNAALASR
jgi:hypothetical protein